METTVLSSVWRNVPNYPTLMPAYRLILLCHHHHHYQNYVGPALYTGWAKNGINFVHLIISPNISQFSKLFYCQNQQTICSKTITTNPITLCVATLPCEISDDALKPATPLISCVINVDRTWHVAPKQPELKSRQLYCSLFGMFFNRWPINVDDSRQSTS